MTRATWLTGVVGLTLLAGPATAAPVPAAASPLSLIPAQTPVVVQLHGLERTKGRLAALAQNALPALAPLVRLQLDQMVNQLTEERRLTGLAADGPILFLLNALPDPEDDEAKPPFTILVRVTSYQQFRDGFLTADERKILKPDPAGFEVTTLGNETGYFIDRGTYAVVTSTKELAQQFQQSPADSLELRLSKQSARRLLDPDLAAYVNMDAINKTYGQQLRDAREGMRQLLQLAANQGGGINRANLEMVQGVYDGIFRFIEDSREALLSGEFRPEGLIVHAECTVRSGSASATALQGAKVSALKDLERQPVGRMVYFGGEDMAGLMNVMRPLLQGGLGGIDYGKVMDQVVKAGPQSYLVSFGLPMTGLYVMKFREPAKVTAAQLEFYRGIKDAETLQAMMLKGPPVVTEDAQNHRGFKLASARMTWDFSALASQPGLQFMEDFMKQLLGETANVWFGNDASTYVMIMADRWDAARQQLDSFLDGKNTLAGQKGYADVRRLLPAEATMLGTLSLTQYAQTTLDAVGPIFKAQGLPIQLPPLKADPARPGYLGFSATLQGDRLEADVALPASTVQDLFQMLAPLMQLRQPAGN